MLRRWITICLLLLGTVCSPVSAQTGNGTETTYSAPQEELLKQWAVRRDLRSLGDDPLGLTALDTLNSKRIYLSISDVPEISLALLREARNLIEAGKTEAALKLIDYAASISRNMLEPHLFKIRLHLTGKLACRSRRASALHRSPSRRCARCRWCDVR